MLAACVCHILTCMDGASKQSVRFVLAHVFSMRRGEQCVYTHTNKATNQLSPQPCPAQPAAAGHTAEGTCRPIQPIRAAETKGRTPWPASGPLPPTQCHTACNSQLQLGSPKAHARVWCRMHGQSTVQCVSLGATTDDSCWLAASLRLGQGLLTVCQPRLTLPTTHSQSSQPTKECSAA